MVASPDRRHPGWLLMPTRIESKGDVDFVLPEDTDPFGPIILSAETGRSWSLNDLWLQLQEAVGPLAHPPDFRTAWFPYPGTVTIAAAVGSYLLGDVIFSVALWIEAEQIPLDAAEKIRNLLLIVQIRERLEQRRCRNLITYNIHFCRCASLERPT